MRHILLFAALMALLTMPARVRGDFIVENKIPQSFTVTNKTVKPAAKTPCNCGVTGECVCFDSQCSCSACGRGGAAPQAKKPGSSAAGITPGTTVRGVAVKDLKRESSAATGPTVTTTDAPLMGLPGGTSGCASGNCPTGTTRTYLIRRR